jgi:hypothetical protein
MGGYVREYGSVQMRWTKLRDALPGERFEISARQRGVAHAGALDLH